MNQFEFTLSIKKYFLKSDNSIYYPIRQSSRKEKKKQPQKEMKNASIR